MSHHSPWLLGAALVAACGGPPAEKNPHLRTSHAPPPEARSGLQDTGTLEPDQIREVMDQHRAGFNNCFQQTPGSFVSGEVRLRFLVRTNGRVEDVTIEHSDLGSWRTEDCLLTTARFLEFPVPAGGGRARFAYPLRWNDPGRRLSTQVDVAWGYPVLVRNRERFQRCRDTHGFAGPFHLTMYVGRLGQVLAAGYDSDASHGTAFPACVTELVQSLRFPDPGQRIVKYRALVEDLPDALTPMNKPIGP